MSEQIEIGYAIYRPRGFAHQWEWQHKNTDDKEKWHICDTRESDVFNELIALREEREMMGEVMEAVDLLVALESTGEESEEEMFLIGRHKKYRQAYPAQKGEDDD